VSTEVRFANNYHDLCQRDGTGAGFQFEFYCEVCQDTWRSPFEPYRAARASGWLRQAGSLAGGLLGGAGGSVDDAVEGVANAGYGVARDKAFGRAIEQAEQHFHRCARCHNYVCAQCWGAEQGLCVQCAPDVAVEVQTERHRGTLDAARQSAYLVGEGRAGQVDVATDHQLVCPACSAEAHGAKFCPQCGHRLASPDTCRSCSTDLPVGSRFCPECGTPAG
jgi:hypothetical protein